MKKLLPPTDSFFFGDEPWPKFTHYEAKYIDKRLCIAPSDDAEIEHRPLSKMPNILGDFLNLCSAVTRTDMDLAPDSQVVHHLLRFCNDYGLLGLFSFYLNEYIVEEDERGKKELRVTLLHRPQWPRPERLQRGLFPLKEYAGLFFPHADDFVPKFRAKVRRPQMSCTGEKSYSEPIEFLVHECWLFRRRLESWEKFKITGESLDDRRYVWPAGIDFEVRNEPSYFYKSLIERLLILFAESITGIRRCEHCRSYFIPSHSFQKSCSSKHSNLLRVNRVRKKQRECRRLFEAGRNAAQIARELNTPLSVITGWINKSKSPKKRIRKGG